MKNKFINHARNVWDRAVTLHPRVDSFWFKYSYMEEMVRCTYCTYIHSLNNPLIHSDPYKHKIYIHTYRHDVSCASSICEHLLLVFYIQVYVCIYDEGLSSGQCQASFRALDEVGARRLGLGRIHQI